MSSFFSVKNLVRAVAVISSCCFFYLVFFAVVHAFDVVNINTIVTDTTASVSWETTDPADAALSYGLTSSYGSATSSSVTRNFHQFNLTGLTPNTTYHFQVTSVDASSTSVSSSDQTFQTDPDTTGPVITNISVATTTGFIIISWNTDEPSNSVVEYGTSESYGNSVSVNESATTHHVYLQAQYFSSSTTYYYRVKSKDVANNQTASPSNTFTLSDSLATPQVSNVNLISLGASKAMLTWTTNRAAVTGIDYGLYGGVYGSSTLDSTLSTNHSVILTGLTNSTHYGYKLVVASDGGGKRYSTDSSYNFTTVTDATAPVISEVSTTKSTTTLAITWTTDEAATSQVDYGTTSSYGSSVSTSTPGLTHSFTITGLANNTTYYYRLQSTDLTGNVATSTSLAVYMFDGSADAPLNERVLVIVNDSMPSESGTGGVGASRYIGSYYAAARSIPDSNILHITTGTGESVTEANYLSQIQTPIQNYLDANGGLMKSKILFIVPTYGVPIRTTYQGETVSVDSYLSTMYFGTTTPRVLLTNPYGVSSRVPGTRPERFANWSFDQEQAGGTKVFAVTRLDGPSVIIVKRIIDDAISAESTLTRSTGTSYFDVDGRHQPDSCCGYNYADQTVFMSGILSGGAGFTTSFNYQPQTGHMIPPASSYFYEDGTGAYSYYQPDGRGVYVQSMRRQSAAASFDIPTLQTGEVKVGLQMLYGTDYFSTNTLSPSVKIILNTSDSAKKIALTYPYLGGSGSGAGKLEKMVGGSVTWGSKINVASSTDSQRNDAVVRIVFDPNDVSVYYDSTLLATMHDPTGTALDINSVTLEFSSWNGLLKSINVLNGASANVYSDDFATDTTANYTWTTQPMGGPNALWVHGWYSGNSSYNAYSFVPGSIGTQFTSYTASRLRSPNDSSSKRSELIQRWWGSWVGRMLEEGVTGTIGTVAEPYVGGYTMGDVFFDHFFTGYNFGESFLLATPTQYYTRWTMMAIGDPLYAPDIFANQYLDTTLPSAPSGLLTTSVSTSTVALSWSPGSDSNKVTGYYIYRNNSLVGSSPATSFTDTGLNPGTAYSYKVATVDAGMNTSTPASAITATTTSASYPSASSVQSTISGNTVTITWNTPVTAYSTLYYGTSTSYTGLAIELLPSTSHSVTLNALLPNTLYNFQITSVSTAGRSYPNSNNTFTTGDAPTIASVAFAAASGGYQVTWTTDRQADSRVYYGTTTALGSVTSSSTLATSHSLLVPDSSAGYFKVVSTDSGGKTATTSLYSFTLTPSSVVMALAGLQGRSAGDLQKSTFRLQLLNPSTGALISEINVGSTASGTVVGSIPYLSGLVDVKVLVPGYLPKQVLSVDLTSSDSVTIPTLTAGDVNNDGVVNSLDASYLNRYWNSSYAAADFNHDGTVNASDLQYLISSWFETGD